jgi:peroxin-19
MMAQLMQVNAGGDVSTDFLEHMMNELNQVQAEKQSPKKSAANKPALSQARNKNTTSTTNTSTTASTNNTGTSNTSSQTTNSNAAGVSGAIDSLLQSQASARKADVIEKDEQEMLKGLLQAGFGGTNFDADAVIDGMMEQLVSKDLMYEPIKQVASCFPKWLRENKGKISEVEYAM